MKTLYTLSKKKTWSWLWLRSWAKFRLKLKKAGKASRPFTFDLNHIPYTVEMINRFEGLGLIDRVPEELWTEVHNIVQESVTKTIPKERNARRQSGCLRRLYKSWGNKRSGRQGIKGKMYPTECRVSENSKEREKSFLNEQCKEREEKNRMGKTRDLFKNIGNIKGTFHARMGTINNRNGKDLTSKRY